MVLHNRHHKWNGFQQQNLFIPQKPETRHQGFAVLRGPGETVACPSPSYWALLTPLMFCVLTIHPPTLSSSSHGIHPVCIFVSKRPLFIRTPAMLYSPNSLIIQDDLFLTSYTCCDPISREGHILGLRAPTYEF